MNEHPLHLCRQMPGLLVDRYDAAGVEPFQVAAGRFAPIVRVRIFSVFVFEELILRVLQLEAVGRQLQLSVEHDPLAGAEYLGEERLVEPDGAQRTGGIPDEHLEDLEPCTARRPDAAADHVSHDARDRTRAEAGNRLEGAAILVADGEPVEQVLDRGEPDPLEVGRAPWPHTLEVLKRGRERIHGRGLRPVAYWTIVDCALPTRISRMLAGSSNGSSMLMPDGFSGVRE